MARKIEPPLYLEMDPDEALERFIGTDPAEVEKLIKASKKRRPPPKGRAEGGGKIRPGPIKKARARGR